MAAPNAWTGVGSLAPARVNPVTVVLQSGKVLLTGGQDVLGGSSLASSEIYDPATGEWSAGPNMTEARAAAVGVLLGNGDVLIAGGFGPDGNTPQTAELYDPSTNAFTPTGNLQQGRADAGVAPLSDGDALIMGGSGLSSAEIYHTATGTFTLDSAMSVPRNDPLVTTLSNGDVLAAGGHDNGNNPLASADVYEPHTHQWTPTSNAMSVAHDSAGIAPLPNGRALVAGGVDGSGLSTNAADLYDAATNSFTAAPPMTDRRASFAMAPLANGDVVAAGGINIKSTTVSDFDVLASTEIYDPARNAWLPAGSLPVPVWEPGFAVLANGEPIVAGGVSQGFSANDAAVFHPAFAPAAPTGVTATAGDGSALVTFAPPASDNGSRVTSYTVTASTGQAVTISDGRTTATVTGLHDGTPVTFAVTATNAIGTGAASAPSAVVTPSAPVTTPQAGSRPAPDTPAKLRLSGVPMRLTLKRFLKGVSFAVTPSKAAALQVTLTGTVNRAVISRFNLTLASKKLKLASGRRTIKLVPSRKLVGHPRSARVQVTILAVDAAGTRTVVTRTVAIRG
ncbi:MAG TPA: kelch repeat-containing protein [Solirubrobacteraceae bacterium]|nr:kelch repeat-containing protein [Solirubrobacteraceae bacterium]